MKRVTWWWNVICYIFGMTLLETKVIKVSNIISCHKIYDIERTFRGTWKCVYFTNWQFCALLQHFAVFKCIMYIVCDVQKPNFLKRTFYILKIVHRKCLQTHKSILKKVISVWTLRKLAKCYSIFMYKQLSFLSHR